MSNPFRAIKKKLVKALEWGPKLHPLPDLVKIGSPYGGWVIPDNILNSSSVCYLAGAGEDISFDVGLVEKYHCHAYIFDPTPRAKAHYEALVAATKAGQPMPVNGNPAELYDLSVDKLQLLHFSELGLWDQEEEIKFYSPANPDFVSHSALNLSKTDTYFVAKVNRLSDLMKQRDHRELDLLKIDIEGAEYKVLESVVADKVKIKILCVEYDEVNSPLDKDYMKRIRASVESLLSLGYKVVDRNAHHNYTFVADSVL